MSEIKVDTLTGKTTANDITVTVGATATQSLEQGLAKAWIRGTYSGGTPSDSNSFAVSSLVDSGTGWVIINVAHSFDIASYAINLNTHQSANVDASQNVIINSASQADIRFYESSTVLTDPSSFYCSIHGDLA
jgi:hypothetical protein